jgi:diguanylate cyclase (GGDEF)-like protein/PAS domain S-box-containing protein
VAAERARDEAEEVLRLTASRFEAMVRHSSDIVVVIDERGMIRYVSPSATRVLGYEDAGVLAAPVFELIHPDDRDLVIADFERKLTQPPHLDPMQFRIRHGDGTWHWMEAVGTNLIEEPAVQGIVVNVRDINDRKAAEAELARRALHDELTGLPNRTLLVDRIQQALHRTARTGDVAAVLLLDLDRFKVLNDSHGHARGDELLVSVAHRLRSVMRAGDTVGRFGGDEFVVVCDVSGVTEARAIADRVASALEQPFELGTVVVHLSASVGIALGDQPGTTPDVLLRDADAAMYRAKDRGRSRYEVFDSVMRRRAVARMDLETELRRALDNGEFVVHYQPEVGLRSAAGRYPLVGVEALVRWDHPRRGLVPPSEFIPLAEELGLVVPLGRQVLRTVCREPAGWEQPGPAAGPRPWMAVNLSVRQLVTPGLVDEIGVILAETGLAPSRLCLEITETMLVEDAGIAGQVLHGLKDIGANIAIDDFGTGFSSLSHLKRFPVDFIKVDREFVDGVGTDAGDTAIVTAVIGMAHALDIPVIAEGVETAAQLEALQGLGCDYGQGYLFSRPVPAGELRTLAPGAAFPAGA